MNAYKGGRTRWFFGENERPIQMSPEIMFYFYFCYARSTIVIAYTNTLETLSASHCNTRELKLLCALYNDKGSTRSSAHWYHRPFFCAMRKIINRDCKTYPVVQRQQCQEEGPDASDSAEFILVPVIMTFSGCLVSWLVG